MAEILIALKLGGSALMFLWHLPFSLSEQMPDDLERTAVAFTRLPMAGWHEDPRAAGITQRRSQGRDIAPIVTSHGPSASPGGPGLVMPQGCASSYSTATGTTERLSWGFHT